MPIIAVTGKVVPGERQRCIDAGANDYVPKPVDTDELIAAIGPWLPTRRPVAACGPRSSILRSTLETRLDASDGGMSPVPILIVDDNAAKRLALKAVLQPLGHTIVEAESGLAALRCVMAQDFAVILLDVRMPIMDGFETAALIRKRQQSELTPIIFITAYGSDEIATPTSTRRARSTSSSRRFRPTSCAPRSRSSRTSSSRPRRSPRAREGRARRADQLRRPQQRAHRAGAPGPADRAGQPPGPRAGSRAPRGAGRALRAPLLHGGARRRSLQVVQRHLRPPGRRPRARSRSRRSSGTGPRGDALYRFGGDEFLCVFPEQSLGSAARDAVERMRVGVERLAHPARRQSHAASSPSAPASPMLDPGHVEIGE